MRLQSGGEREVLATDITRIGSLICVHAKQSEEESLILINLYFIEIELSTVHACDVCCDQQISDRNANIRRASPPYGCACEWSGCRRH